MSATIRKIQQNKPSRIIVPSVLLAISIISYAVSIRKLGFYWDDFPSIFYLHFLGPSGFHDAFSVDRPLLAWVFQMTTQLAGESILKWQLFGILTRWLSSVMLWWTLVLLWKDHHKQATWIALLFAVYPGFSQQYISVTYSNAFLVFSIFLASYATMILAFQKRDWFIPLITVSLAFSAFSLFTSEYFFGLELMRPAIIYLCLEEDRARKQILKTISRWIPYLLIVLIFLFWRLYLTETPRGDIQIFGFLKSNPLIASLYMIYTVIKDLIQVTFLSWWRVFTLEKLTKFGNHAVILYITISILTAIFALIFLFLYRKEKNKLETRANNVAWARQALWIGVFSMFLAGLPFWATYLPIKLQFPQDRFTMPFMVGACITLIALFEFLIRRETIILLILGILVGASAGFHYYNSLLYAREWDFQKTFFWQLSWRVPTIEPGTLLLTPELPFNYYSDNSLTAPLNLIYAPDNTSREMPYMIFDLDARLYNAISTFEKGQDVQGDYRAMNFSGTTSQVLGFFFAPPRCVTIIDPSIEQLIPNQELYIPEALALSDPAWIKNNNTNAAILPERYYGNQLAPSWCYYFEKADLARQFSDWDQIAALGEAAKTYLIRLTPANAIELTPFVEGYAKTGNWQQALDWSQTAYKKNEKTQTRLCTIWQESLAITSEKSIPLSVINHIENELECE